MVAGPPMRAAAIVHPTLVVLPRTTHGNWGPPHKRQESGGDGASRTASSVPGALRRQDIVKPRVQRRLRDRRGGDECGGHGYILILDWLAPCRNHGPPLKPAMPVRSVEIACANEGEGRETLFDSLKTEPKMTHCPAAVQRSVCAGSLQSPVDAHLTPRQAATDGHRDAAEPIPRTPHVPQEHRAATTSEHLQITGRR